MAYLVVFAACALAMLYNKENRTIYALVMIAMVGLWLGPYLPKGELYCERDFYRPLCESYHAMNSPTD